MDFDDSILTFASSLDGLQKKQRHFAKKAIDSKHGILLFNCNAAGNMFLNDETWLFFQNIIPSGMPAFISFQDIAMRNGDRNFLNAQTK